MAVRTILVCLNETARTDALLHMACGLASTHDAHLIGVYVIPAMQVQPGYSIHVAPEIFEGHREFFIARAGKIKDAFNESLRKQGLRGEWRQIESDSHIVADAVVQHGRQCDLIIIGQIDPMSDEGVELDFGERVVMETGRPVVIVPRVGTFETIGQQVLIGWNATREAARAAFDALPLISQAKEARIVWVDPNSDWDDSGDLPGAELAAALSRQGITATAEALPTGDLAVADALLNRVSDTGADLLVMGAYGHSRLREYVFGGATKDILSHMTVPVLMSH